MADLLSSSGFYGLKLHSFITVVPQFRAAVTRVEVNINKVKVIDISYTGSPVNVISSRLAREIKMAPDLNDLVVYGTAGLAITKYIGDYYAHNIFFGS